MHLFFLIDKTPNYSYYTLVENKYSFGENMKVVKLITIVLILTSIQLFSADGLPDISVAELPVNFTFETESFNSIDTGTRSTPSFADIDGDGLLDMLVGESDGKIYHYEQDNFNFSDFILVTDFFDSIDVGDRSAPIFTDIDDDGLLDLIIGEQEGNINHYKQNSLNSLDFTLVLNTFDLIDVGDYSTPTFADIDSDGLFDMLVGEFEGNINHYEQTNIDSFDFALVTESFNSIDIGSYSKPTLTDLDGDGLFDLIIGEQDGNINHYEQNSSNSLDFTLVPNTFDLIDVGGDSAPTIADLEEDGLLDLLIGEYDGNINHYKQIEVEELNFGWVIAGSYSLNKYMVASKYLTDDVTIQCNGEGYSISLNENTGFTDQLIISPLNGMVSDTIYVKLSPDSLRLYTGNISHSSADCVPYILSLAGTGVGIDHMPGTALDFDGVDDFVQIDNSIIGNPEGSFTIEAWVKLKTQSACSIISKQSDFGMLSGYVIEYNPAEGIKALLADNTGWRSIRGDVWNLNEWHHVALCYNDTINTLKLFDNGVLAGAISTNEPIYSNINLRFGNSEYYDAKFHGVIEEVRFWNVERTVKAIRENMYIPVGNTELGLEHYFQFNEGSDNSVNSIGILHNMNDTDWIDSTIPFGSGHSFTQVVSSTGSIDFTDTGIWMDIISKTGIDTFVVTRIDSVPNTIAEYGEVFDSQYWIFRKYGKP